jgi:hypothetical protein
MAPLKSSLARTGKKLLGLFNQSDLTLRGATQTSRFVPTEISATGGSKIPSGGYMYHVFSFPNSDNFVVSSGSGDVEVLVVAGGGGGGSQHGGGGGAGGVLHHTGFAVAPGTYPVTVGGGGAGALAGPGTGNGTATYGASGSNSYFGPPSSPNGLTADGGGGAFPSGRSGTGGPQPLVFQNAPPTSNPYQGNGLPGGSGGGTGGENNLPGGDSTQNPMNGATGYGNSGGTSSGSGSRGSGGGGAGGAGTDGGPPAPSGKGGNGQAFNNFPAPVIQPGIPSPEQSAFTSAVGSSGTFAGGGGRGGPGERDGGPGGGGDGGAGPNPGTSGGAGVYGTGGGGGGSGGMGANGGAGGSGIVILRYSE